MNEALGYLSDVKARLVASPTVAAITIVAEYASEDRGYFRARLALVNRDFLVVSEYVMIQAGRPGGATGRVRRPRRKQQLTPVQSQFRNTTGSVLP